MKNLDENKQETKEWPSLFENKVETLITDIEKVQGSVTDTNSEIELNNERQRQKKYWKMLESQKKMNLYQSS